MRSAAASCLLVLVAATSASAIVTYQDGTFSNANWVIETTSIGGGGTGSGVQVSGVGTPGEARRVTSSVNAPAGSAITGRTHEPDAATTTVRGAPASVTLALRLPERR